MRNNAYGQAPYGAPTLPAPARPETPEEKAAREANNVKWNQAYGTSQGNGRPTTPASPAPAPAPADPGHMVTTPGELSGPGYGEQDYLAHKDWYDQPTASSGYYDAAMGEWPSLQASEGRMYADAANLRGMNTPIEQLWEKFSSGAMPPDEAAQFFAQYGGQLGSRSEGYNVMGQTLPELSQQGAMERFNAEGLQQYYDRQYETGARKLDTAAAARGGFNSGAALRSIQELGADLSAQQAKDRMAAAQAAQEAMLARLTQKGTVGGKLDAARRDDLLAGGTLAEKASIGADRLRDDERETARGATDAAFDKLTKAAGIEKDATGAAITRIAVGGNLAGQADTKDLAKRTAGHDAAIGAENERETGAGNEFDRTLALGNAQGNAVMTMMDTAQKEQWTAFMTQIEAMVKSGAITAEEKQAAAEDMLAFMKIPASVAGMSKWGSEGGTNNLVQQFLRTLNKGSGAGAVTSNADPGIDGVF